VYEPWREIKPGATNAATWRIRVKDDLARVGIQIHAPHGTEILDPYVELGSQRWSWQGTLAEGQFLFFWPGEPITRYGSKLKNPERRQSAA